MVDFSIIFFFFKKLWFVERPSFLILGTFLQAKYIVRRPQLAVGQRLKDRDTKSWLEKATLQLDMNTEPEPLVFGIGMVDCLK